MTPMLIAAGEALAMTLEQENAALEVLDLAVAAALFPRKDAVCAAFMAAQQQLGGQPAAPDAEQLHLAQELAERLRALAEENRRLLERAIRVQRQVLGTVARAIARTVPRAQSRYGAHGAFAEARRQAPVMLSARA